MHKILLIEDNEAIRENTSELLELEGYSVLSARNGKEGLQMANELKPDLIFCDIMMPEANGYEVFKELKQNPDTAGIPFIFLTASVEKREVETGLGMGADGYIRKPFEPQELFDAVSCFLKKK
jgi:CheY-like chemotaxis protein